MVQNIPRDGNGFPMPDEVPRGLPAVSLYDLGRGSAVIHCMSGDEVLSIGGPMEAENVGGSGGGFEGVDDAGFRTPIVSPPYSQRLIVRLRRQIFADGIPANAFDERRVAFQDGENFREFFGVPDDDGVVYAARG